MTMTDTEAKALALVNEFRAKCAEPTLPVTMSHVWAYGAAWEALCRVIEREAATEARHAAELRELKERFSEAVERVLTVTDRRQETHAWRTLSPFILPAPDPLVEVIKDLSWDATTAAEEWAKDLRAALAARGGKIVWEDGE